MNREAWYQTFLRYFDVVRRYFYVAYFDVVFDDGVAEHLKKVSQENI